MKIQKVLKKYATVVSLDEHYTSKIVCVCGKGENKNLNYWVMKENMEHDLELKLSKCHGGVHFSSNECAITWQRDRVSSINHKMILRNMLNGEETLAS